MRMLLIIFASNFCIGNILRDLLIRLQRSPVCFLEIIESFRLDFEAYNIAEQGFGLFSFYDNIFLLQSYRVLVVLLMR